MTTPLLAVRDLVRSFDQVRAVDSISFDLEPGQVVGLIGANGAGKTTTMKMLATLDLPDAGTIRLGGVDIVDYPNAVRRRLGWMPDHFTPPRNLTVGDYLDFFARAHGLRGPELGERVKEVMDFTELGRLIDRPIDKLSKGETQRLCMGRTLLNDPDFLLLDEPAAGLDPKARIEFKNLVRLLRQRGKTLLISSHILSELGEMCDTLIFMDAGRIVHHGDTESLQRKGTTAGVVFDIVVHGLHEPLLDWIAVRPGWKLVEDRREGVRALFHLTDPLAIAGELKRLTTDSIAVVEFRRLERRLEDAFVDMLRTGRAANSPEKN